MHTEITFNAKLWEWHGKGAWQFITVPEEHAAGIRLFSTSVKRGFGSVRVEVTVGNTTWKTSVFPDTKSNSYLLPIKKYVRQSEKLNLGDLTLVTVRILEV